MRPFNKLRSSQAKAVRRSHRSAQLQFLKCGAVRAQFVRLQVLFASGVFSIPSRNDFSIIEGAATPFQFMSLFHGIKPFLS